MAKPMKFPVRRTTRLAELTDQKLIVRAKRNGREPAVEIREIVEAAVQDEKTEQGGEAKQ